MDALTIIAIAIGLSMDAFAVSITSGVTIKNCGVRHALLIGGFFGGFQALMPVVGWLMGLSLKSFISEYANIIAFAILVFIGAKMVYESFVMGKAKEKCGELSMHVLLGLSLATSIDALAVGTTFAFLNVIIFLPVLIIGLTTFVFSYAGVFIGRRFGGMFENKVEIAGGIFLMLIGVKILIGS